MPAFDASSESRVQVGCQNLEGPARQLFLLQQKHRQRVGFFSRRTAGGPETQPLESERGFLLHDLRQHHRSQRVQLRRVAEHVGLANRDFIQQLVKFGIAGGADGETIEVLEGAVRPAHAHTAIATCDQQVELLLGMVDARDAVDQIADLEVRGFRGARASLGRRGR